MVHRLLLEEEINELRLADGKKIAPAEPEEVTRKETLNWAQETYMTGRPSTNCIKKWN